MGCQSHQGCIWPLHCWDLAYCLLSTQLAFDNGPAPDPVIQLSSHPGILAGVFVVGKGYVEETLLSTELMVTQEHLLFYLALLAKDFWNLKVAIPVASSLFSI